MNATPIPSTPPSGMFNTALRLVLSLLATGLIAGCTFTHPVRQEALPQPAASAMVPQWPLSVGLYIPAGVKSRVFAQQAWRVPAGEPVASSFRWSVERMFARVVMLDQPPSARTLPNGLAGIIELSDIAFEYGVPGSLRYEITLYSSQGDRLDRWPVTTTLPIWDIGESSWPALMQTVGDELGYAIRDVLAQFMVHFADRPAVQGWLAGNGIAPAQVRPASSTDQLAPPAAPRILLVPNIATWLHTDSARAMACVGRRLAQANPPFAVIPTEQARREFFPWLEPSTAPKTVEAMQRWLAEPAIRMRMRASGARWLLEFQGDTKTDLSRGGVLCGAAYGGGGCFGFAWGSRESSFRATLLDMWGDDAPIDARSTQHSGAYLPAFGLPIPLMAATESTACEELSRQIHALLVRGSQ